MLYIVYKVKLSQWKSKNVLQFYIITNSGVLAIYIATYTNSKGNMKIC